TDHASVERTHQTMTSQALLGQIYTSPDGLWTGLDKRRAVLNQFLPIRALSRQAPLEAYPEAVFSGRAYRPEWEEALFDQERVYQLAFPFFSEDQRRLALVECLCGTAS